MVEQKLNAIVFIDYENVHYNLINNYKNVFELNFFQKTKKYLNDKGFEIVDTIAYCNYDISDMYNSYHQTKLHQLGIDTRHTTNNGKNYADIQITADVLNVVYGKDNSDCIILISNDKDMTPLIKSVRKTKLEMNLILFKECFDRVLLEYPNNYYFIENILETKLYMSEDKIEDIYNNIEKYIDEKYNNGMTTPFLLSLEKYLESTTKWFKLFEYEIVRILSLLEKENKIFIYIYNLGYGKDFVGISTTKYESIYNSYDKVTITKSNSYFNEEVQKQYYKKYIKTSQIT